MDKFIFRLVSILPLRLHTRGDIKKFYGDRFYVEDRPRKYRYIYITGSKTEKKQLLRQLKYKIEQYPKNVSKEL